MSRGNLNRWSLDERIYEVYTGREVTRMMTTIQKWGNSQGVRLPKSILDELSLQENDPIEIVAANDSIIIMRVGRKRRAKKSLEERFDNYDGDYKCSECDWGKPVGKEVW